MTACDDNPFYSCAVVDEVHESCNQQRLSRYFHRFRPTFLVIFKSHDILGLLGLKFGRFREGAIGDTLLAKNSAESFDLISHS